MEEFEVFRRNWWRIENGKRVPDPSADRIHIGYAETQDEAREMCADYNDFNDEGELSHKAEYQRV